VKRLLLLLALLLVACRSADLRPDADIDELARGAGMPALIGTPLTAGTQEMRLWVWGGLANPHHLLRMTYAHDRWMGEIWRFWPRADADLRLHDSYDELMDRCGCARIVHGSRYSACRVREETAIDWEALARRLKELNAAGPAEASGETGLLDVEVRAGGEYHHYDTPPVRRAGEIVKVVEDLDVSLRHCD
jgi:hypothetical protein